MTPERQFPGPVLQTTPWQDLRQFRTAEDTQLKTYGWIDQKGGVARLPIDKAKELLLQRGLPTRAVAGDPAEGTHVAASGEANGGRTIPAGQADKSTPRGNAPAGTAASPTAQPTAEAAKKPGGGL
jgi:hypothetical protein